MSRTAYFQPGPPAVPHRSVARLSVPRATPSTVSHGCPPGHAGRPGILRRAERQTRAATAGDDTVREERAPTGQRVSTGEVPRSSLRETKLEDRFKGSVCWRTVSAFGYRGALAVRIRFLRLIVKQQRQNFPIFTVLGCLLPQSKHPSILVIISVDTHVCCSYFFKLKLKPATDFADIKPYGRYICHNNQK